MSGQAIASRGSEWALWDFHVHTPASYYWNGQCFRLMASQEDIDRSLTEQVECINDSPAAAFVFMDYWSFDGFIRLRRFLRRNSNVKLKKAIFPGIELRVEAPVDFRMNLHFVLDDSLSDQELADFRSRFHLLLVNRPLSDEALASIPDELAPDKFRPLGHSNTELADPEKRYQIGCKAALVSRDSLFEAIKSLPEGKALLFLPFDTYNGARGINWKEHPLLTTEYLRSAHIYEARQPEAIAAFRGIKTEENKGFFDNFLHTIGKKAKPAVSGSDAHKFSDYANFTVGNEGPSVLPPPESEFDGSR